MDIPTLIENRLVDLEIKAGFTEDLLDQLNAQVYRQQQQIDALIQELRQMRDRLVAAATMLTWVLNVVVRAC